MTLLFLCRCRSPHARTRTWDHAPSIPHTALPTPPEHKF
jgi:hypothetical protein